MNENENEQDIWERREDETPFWYARFLLFLNAGPGRKLLTTVHLVEMQENEKCQKAGRSAKKLSIATPGSWNAEAKAREWKVRATAWDEEQERIALAECKYTRVSERAKLIDRWISTQDTIMIAHVEDKGYARADSMEQLRGWLDDMAKETGGRAKVSKKDVTHHLPKEYLNMPDDDGIEE